MNPFLIFYWFLRLVPACPAEGWVTSEYGFREDPIRHVRRFHSGVDIANEAGTPVRTPFAGKILRKGRNRHSGRYVVVQSGSLRMTFMHLQKTFVRKGQKVSLGEQIGLMGSSGRSTGPHLHFEIRKKGRGAPMDPSLFLIRCPVLD